MKPAKATSVNWGASRKPTRKRTTLEPDARLDCDRLLAGNGGTIGQAGKA
jgi:hypothetical protein